jgi:F0F1-type ATP synthase delta subunit
MKNHYIQALLQMIAEGSDIDLVLKGLSTILKAKGHTRLHASILHGVLRVLSAESLSHTTRVVTASETDAIKFAVAIKHALRELGTEEGGVVEVDDSLIGGFIAEHNNVIIDTSYKAKLVSLYRSLAQ